MYEVETSRIKICTTKTLQLQNIAFSFAHYSISYKATNHNIIHICVYITVITIMITMF